MRLCPSLEKRLRLRFNREKRVVVYLQERSYAGYRLVRGGGLGIASKSPRRVQTRIRQITRRNRRVSLEQMIQELNAFLSGWQDPSNWLRCKGGTAGRPQATEAMPMRWFAEHGLIALVIQYQT